MLKLYLTRHGETEWNIEKKMQGRKNSPLTSLGIQQAQLLGNRLKETPIDLIYSSPSERAVQTAEIIRGERDIPVINDSNLLEMDLGAWEGQTFDKVKEKDPQEYHHFWYEPHLYSPVNNGETFTKVLERALTSVNQWIQQHKGQQILVVSHSVFLKRLMNYFENQPLDKLWADPYMHSASLSMIELDEKQAKIVQYADCSHLESIHIKTT
ncbi:histidine phosphatase family protein [Hazenella coriacea]|uniref:Phosphoglycerate mutase n=1 Tax=Hazenella coriacea TaxID=1179467 RepID=A0A4V2UV06_9BACL|nr:histidine phosphatase family protein [Hazenella coriacea]TCS93857.1 phosphoglycerate mutase [Hazenella coriacea]